MSREVALHQRLERGVDRGRRRAPVLAHDRVELVRERVRHAGQLRLEQLADAQLVRGVGDRPQQADGDRLDARAARSSREHRGARAASSSGVDDLALGADPLGDLEREARAGRTARDTGGEVERAQLAALAPEHEHVAGSPRW